ncbi:ABC transporter permease [Candidatus Poribacteria bacterium]|nr:ABC transporter permease [Candidatus Poribacteria bacterium]
MKQLLAITRKEVGSYFGSPLAFIFLGVFLTSTLFLFFWFETFFARGVADVRPLFRWLPVLTVFLVAALTMRQWSEEQNSGTLEMLLTLPVTSAQLVLGKFLAVMALIGIAFALTLPLPITVAFLGDLDGGPVVGGYLAAALLASSYAAIGLFLSSRTSNQIVALISTALVGGIFYLVGTRGVTDFVGPTLGGVFRAVGTGSRFESIERGVVDLRDLVYYGSVTGLFLILNAMSLDTKRWSAGRKTRLYRRAAKIGILLAALNLVFLNLWLHPLYGLRADLTEQREYSLSDTTRQLTGALPEPLVIRAYMSDKTHPLLEPLKPQIADMLKEYEINSKGLISTEVVDPSTDPDLEEEATQTYGIRPTPFMDEGRYQSTVINSYFDILVRYGDQHTLVGFQDMIEIERRRDGSMDIRLRNLEYDLTRAIKKVVFGFQSVDAVLAALESPATFTLFVTPNTLPATLAEAETTIRTVAEGIAEKSGGKFRFRVVDPDDANSGVTREAVFTQYGLRAIPTALFSTESYYLGMALDVGTQRQAFYSPGDLTEASVRTAIESSLKRTSTGFLKVVGIWKPPNTPKPGPFGQPQQPFAAFDMIAQQLRSDYTVRDVDLASGQVDADIDVLLVIAPQELDDKKRFAIDQFLMRGGSVVAAAGNYTVEPEPFTGSLSIKPVSGGIRDMLAAYGVDITESLVMDPQNEPFPLTVTRDMGGFQMREIQRVNYPYFVDVRPDGMDKANPITANLPATTIYWASPIALDAAKNAERETGVLLKSTAAAWTTTDTAAQPDFTLYPQAGFHVGTDKAQHALAVAVKGSFESYFKDKPSPFLEDAADEPDPEDPTAEQSGPTPVGVLESSPDSSRLVVVSSAEFVNDPILRLSSVGTRDRYLNNLQFLQNAIDWSVEDVDLLSIRSRGTHARVLDPMDDGGQTFWEVLNYAIALAALAAIGAVWYLRRRHEKPMTLTPAAGSND